MKSKSGDKQIRGSHANRPYSRRRVWGFRFLAFSLSLAVGLLALEILVRWLELEGPVYPMAKQAIVLYYEDPNGQVRLTPNWEGYVSGVWTQINANGFRDIAYSSKPGPGTIRIAVLGDSYTMGDGVSLEKSYPKQLQALLRERHQVEVLNCGISATNTKQQVPTLRDVLERFKPDVVVLGYNVNDFKHYKTTRFENLQKAGFHYHVHDDETVTVNRDLNLLHRIKLAIRQRSYLWRYLARLRSSGGVSIDLVAQVRQNVGDRNHLNSIKAVTAMQRLCDAHGVRFVVFVLPGLLDVPATARVIDEYPFHDLHDMIREQLGLHGVKCFDLVDAFAGKRIDHLIVSQRDRHYNDTGNALIADAMAQRLVDHIHKRRSNTNEQSP